MQEKRKEKPKYNMWQSTKYMLSVARQAQMEKCVLILAGMSVLQVGVSVVQLFLSPVILRNVEQGASLGRLLTSIFCFTLLLMLLDGAVTYMNACTIGGKVSMRTEIIRQVQQKAGSTSYPNLEEQRWVKLREKALGALGSNSSAGEMVWNTYSELLKNMLGFLIYLSMLTAVNPVLVGITVLTTLLSYLENRHNKKWTYRHREEEAEYIHRTNYILRSAGLRSLAKDLRIFGMQQWLLDIYDSNMRLYNDYFARKEKNRLAADLINVALTFARNGAAYLYLIVMTFSEGLSASQFLLYFSAVGGFASWIGGILNGFARLYEQNMDLSTIQEYLDMPELFKKEEGEHITPEGVASCRLEMRDVSFCYPGSDREILKHINLVIEPGEKLALVGLNGAGKTTLVKLLCGFYDPTQGQVLLNGRDIRELNRDDYYGLFSAVFQKFSTLPVSIAENVAQTSEDIDRKRVEDCIEKAGLKELIERMPEGYATPVGKDLFENGTELSGGERQRLMLARALYKDAPMIVLDEPTAALDPLAEQDMYQKYHSMTEGKTSLYISHRLVSTRFCDRVLYMEDGQIKECGTHEELLLAGGKYAKLFEVQRKYYREGVVYEGEE